MRAATNADRHEMSGLNVSTCLSSIETSDNILADEGLVDIAPQRGSTVSLVKIADVREYMLIRKGLESEALRVLIGKHDSEVNAKVSCMPLTSSAVAEDIELLRVNMAAVQRTPTMHSIGTAITVTGEMNTVVKSRLRIGGRRERSMISVET